MESFQGKVMRGGQLLFDKLTGSLNIQSGAAGSWTGILTVPSGTPVRAGGPYRLILADGRSGDIMIENVSKTSHRPTIVGFKGVGPLK